MNCDDCRYGWVETEGGLKACRRCRASTFRLQQHGTYTQGHLSGCNKCVDLSEPSASHMGQSYTM